MKTSTAMTWNIICLLAISLFFGTGPAALAEDLTLTTTATETDTVEFTFEVEDAEPTEDEAETPAEEDDTEASGSQTTPVPEPATLGVIIVGLLGILLVGRRWVKEE
jgi:hypothetical protein